MRKMQGVVLISVLLFLTLFSFLSLQAVEASILSVKLSQHAKTYHSVFYRAEAGLREGENRIAQGSSCRLRTENVLYYSQQTENWWRSQACQSQAESGGFYYIIEALGTYPCVRLPQAKDFPVDYFRVTSFAESDDKLMSVILQSTFVIPALHPVVCEGEYFFVKTGRQSWHQIN